MADFHFQCPGCGARLVIDAAAAGCSVECPHCGSAVALPLLTPEQIDLLAQGGSTLRRERDEARAALGEALKKAGQVVTRLEAVDKELAGLRDKEAESARSLAEKSAQAEGVARQLAESSARVAQLEAEARALADKIRLAEKEQSADRKVREDIRKQLDELRAVKKQLSEREIELSLVARQREGWDAERARHAQFLDEAHKVSEELGRKLAEKELALAGLVREKESLQADLQRQQQFLDEVRQASEGLMRENQELKDKLGAFAPPEEPGAPSERPPAVQPSADDLVRENRELKARLRVLSAGLRHRV